MFTGIIETVGIVRKVIQEGSNIHFTFESPISKELKIDQSVAHNGVCLTVIDVNDNTHTVTAIDETLKKTNMGDLKAGDTVNLERCMQLNARLDGHIVQGHIDQTAICTDKKTQDGSWIFTFQYDASKGNVTVEKGSITINGASLTVCNSQKDAFSVCTIPYTFEHTNFCKLGKGMNVNLEFDIIGKYVARLMGK